MMNRNSLLLLSLLCSFVLNANHWQEAVDAFAGDTLLRHAHVGVAFVDTRNGELLAAHEPDIVVGTASTMKTVTSSVALERLGADFRFHTRVTLRGTTDEGRFKGHVVVYGAGDPTLGSRYMTNQADFVAEVVAAVKQRGITSIEGDIVIDDSLYPDPNYNDTWEVGDLPWYYGAGVHGLNWADNVLTVGYDAINGRVENIVVTPAVPELKIINKLRVGRYTDRETSLDFGDPALVLGGVVKPGHYTAQLVNPLPGSMLAEQLRRALQRNGLSFERVILPPLGSEKTLIDHESPTVSDIVTSLLDRSDNMFTEALLRAVAHAANRPGTPSEGVKQVLSCLKKMGIDPDGLHMYDGSGLSRWGKATPLFFTRMLTVMAQRKQSDGKRLCDLMPAAGKRIGDRLAGTVLAKQLRVKSGSMTRVQCFVGYLMEDDEPTVAFVVLLNDFESSNGIKDLIGKMLIKAYLSRQSSPATITNEVEPTIDSH